MTIKEADTEIAAWRERQKLIAENLDSFTELPEFHELCGQGANFTGQTRARLDFALDTLHGLREQHLALTGILDRAAALRDSMSRVVPSRQTLHEIDALLNGKSIELSSGQTPPQRRELLRGVDQVVRVSPGDLMGIMLGSFRCIRDGILSVGAVRDRIAGEMRSQIETIGQLRSAGAPAGELDSLTESHAQLASVAATDPVTADARRADIANRLDEMSLQMQSAKGQMTDARRLLAEASALVMRLRAGHDLAVKTAAEQLAKVETDSPGGSASPAADSAVADLETRLVNLGTDVERGKFGPAVAGLLKWKRAADELLVRDTAAAAAAEKWLRARTDLRGLFESLQAKAAGRSGAGDLKLNLLADQIRTLLQMRPTPLAEAQKLVGRYQRELL